MAKILILHTPHGNQPEWVRKSWFNCKLKTFDIVCGSYDFNGTYYEGPHFVVNRAYAVRILRRKSPRAAQWFKNNRNLGSGFLLLFPASCCKLL